jgi:hypothetical protein
MRKQRKSKTSGEGDQGEGMSRGSSMKSRLGEDVCGGGEVSQNWKWEAEGYRVTGSSISRSGEMQTIARDGDDG